MKNTLIKTVVAGFLSASLMFGMANDPDLAQGRQALMNHDLDGALQAFQHAVDTTGSEPARALLAMTRLAYLYALPESAALLDRWGFPAEGRNLFDWTAETEVDEHSLPADNNLEEMRVFVAETMLPQVLAGVADLEAIQSVDFSLMVTPADLGVPGPDEYAVVDWTDLRLLRAGFGAIAGSARMFITSNRFDMPVEDLFQPLLDPPNTAQSLLGAYPNLLRLHSATERVVARDELKAAIAAYLSVADNLHDPARINALFVLLNERDFDGEMEFREGLLEFEKSMDESVFLGVEPIEVSLRPWFEGFDFRAHLPPFRGNSVLLNSLPDPAMAGILPGMDRPAWAEFFAKERVDFHYRNRWEPGGGYGYVDRSLYPMMFHPEHGWQMSPDDLMGTAKVYDFGTGSWFGMAGWYYPWMYKYGANEGWYRYIHGGRPGSRMFFRAADGQTIPEQEINTPPST